MRDEGLRAFVVVAVGVLIVVALTMLLLRLGVPFLPPYVPVGTR